MTQLRLAVLTTGRQDWGLLRPLCELLESDASFEPLLIAGGMACSRAHGFVVGDIRRNGLPLAVELAWPVEGTDAAAQAGRALEMTASTLQLLEPDALILLGDRYETAAAALAATLVKVPIVHLYGGEETEGAFDNSLRHAITKMSHLHLVSHATYAERVIQMGEDPRTVHVVGSLALDNLRRLCLPLRSELGKALGHPLEPPVGIVTVQPTTLADTCNGPEVAAVVEVMERLPATWVVTLPNADPGNEAIRDALLDLSGRRENVIAVAALGSSRYLGLLKAADFVLGNSSSGMTEAPAVGVPTINVGDRQRGRLRCPSIIDVPADAEQILGAIRQCLTPEFKRTIKDMPPLYGSGDSGTQILTVLSHWKPPRPPRKRFTDLSVQGCGKTT